MPVNPIDLQLMFSRLNQVGKEQADKTELQQIQQSLQAGAIVKNTDRNTNSVTESRDLGPGIEKSRDREKRKDGRREPSEKRDEPKSHRVSDDVLKDPELGRHFDLSG
jgi:hypothetical protein